MEKVRHIDRSFQETGSQETGFLSIFIITNQDLIKKPGFWTSHPVSELLRMRFNLGLLWSTS